MSSFFSSDGSFSLQFAIIFVVIFLILAAGVLLLRRFTGQGRSLSNKTPPRGRQPRLGIVDIYELDRQRQLILLRRDNVEHLLLVGGPNDVVVERNITRGINARLPLDEPSYDEPSEPVPDPSGPAPVDARAELSVPAQAVAPAYPAAAPYLEPRFEMPVAVPAPAPQADAAPPPVARPLDLSPRLPVDEEARPPAASVPPRPKESQLARVIRRAPPSLVNLVPAGLAERARLTEQAPEVEPAPRPEMPAGAFGSSQSPPPVSPPAARAIDAAILSDMARQLEEALRRPAAAVRPAAPVQSTPPVPALEAREPATGGASTGTSSEPEVAPHPDPEQEPQAIDPIAAAMAATAHEPAPPVEADRIDEREVGPDRIDETLFADDAGGSGPASPEPSASPERSEPVFVDAGAPQPDAQASTANETAVPAEAEVQEEPVVHAAIADAPVIEEPVAAEPDARDGPPFVSPAPEAPANPLPAPPPPAPPPPASKPASSPNPFSVEEIEAEFARLLGRPLDKKQ